MSRVKIFSVKRIALKQADYKHVKIPVSGFTVLLELDKSLEPLLQDPKIRKTLEQVAKAKYASYLLQTTKRMRGFDRLFAGMLAKGAAAGAVAKQAKATKQALEKETPKWEKASQQAVLEVLKKLAKKKR